MRPAHPVTVAEAASILGCSMHTVHDYVDASRIPAVHHYEHHGLDLDDVERLATHVYPWLRHRNDPEAYWVTGQWAAAALGVSRDALTELGDKQQLPFLVHRDGTRLYRRQQLTDFHHTHQARQWV